MSFLKKIFRKPNAKDILLNNWRKDFIKRNKRDPDKKEEKKGELAIDIVLSVLDEYKGLNRPEILFKQKEIKRRVNEIMVKNGIDPNEF